MGTGNRQSIHFARIAILAGTTVIGVIAVGLVLTSNHGWTSVEMAMLHYVNLFHTAPLDGLALGIDWLFGPATAAVLVLLGSGVVLVASRRPRRAAQFLVVVVIPVLGTDVIKRIVHRPRPDIASLPHVLVLEPGGLSYPSGHTSFAACVMLGLIVVASQRWRPVLSAVAVVVVAATAASRVYLGVHYPSDVAASIVYSIAAVTLVNAVWVVLMSHWDERQSGAPARPAYRGASDAR